MELYPFSRHWYKHFIPSISDSNLFPNTDNIATSKAYYQNKQFYVTFLLSLVFLKCIKLYPKNKYLFHLMQGVDGVTMFPSGKKREDDVFDLGNGSFDCRWKKRWLNQFLEMGMVWTLMKEDGFRAYHLLFARRISWFEHMWSSHQDVFR